MRKSTLAALAIAVPLTLPIAGCGGDDGASPTTSAQSTSTSTTAETGMLEELLMTLADIGANWRLGNTVGGADFDDANQIPCDDAALNPAIRERLRPIIGRQFEPDDGSYRHLMTTITLGDAGRLALDVGFLIDAIRACPATATFEGSSVSIEQMEMPDLGEQRAAFKITAATDEPVWLVRTAVVRVDRHYLSVSLTEILDTSQTEPSVTDAQFVEIVERAVRRLEQ